MTVELRDFDRNDWMANAGAEPAADGRAPQIGSDDERGVEVLADARHLEVRLYSRDNPGGDWSAMDVYSREGAYDLNVVLAKGITNFEPAALEALGFGLILSESF
jgi:hypothetical protein